jgi:predicted nuclease of predicted toxin-antitoxin system
MTGEQPKPEVWVDAQLPPALALWLRENHCVQAFSLRELGLRDEDDAVIFNEAKKRGCILISKDSDFVDLVQRQGPPPQLIWVTCGNVTNTNLKAIFSAVFKQALILLAGGEAIVEIGHAGASSSSPITR